MKEAVNERTNGFVIMFDGPDGVGKTTQLNLAKNALEASGQKVYSTRIHGGTPIGEALRKVSLSSIERPPKTDLYISMAMHAALAEDIERKSREGYVTLVDRSPLAIIAYQIYGSGLNKEFGLEMTDKTINQFKLELLIVYDAAPKIFEKRASRRAGAADYFESKPSDYFERVAEGYRFGAERYGATIIDASGSIDDVHQQTMTQINAVIKP